MGTFNAAKANYDESKELKSFRNQEKYDFSCIARVFCSCKCVFFHYMTENKCCQMWMNSHEKTRLTVVAMCPSALKSFAR